MKVKEIVCTVCEERPALGVGKGKLVSTCAECIGQFVKDDICPVCRGVGLGSNPEHIANCNGRAPKVKHDKPDRLKKDTNKSPSQIGKEADAADRLKARRERTATTAPPKPKASKPGAPRGSMADFECPKCGKKQKSFANSEISHECPKNKNRLTTFKVVEAA
jgi:ribosomal protein S27E